MKLPYAFRNHSDQLLFVGVLSAAVGAAAGYLYAQRRITKILNQAIYEVESVDITPEEEAQMKLNFADLIETETSDEDPEFAVEAELEEEDDVPVRLIRSVFPDQDADEWDYELEYANRTAHTPYIIHVEEFKANELDLTQDTVTWYEEDGILADSNDKELYDPKGNLGPLLFGHGSGDANVVYIRNERTNMEYEVLRHTGSYAYEVLGQSYEQADERELRHSIRRYRAE